MILNVGVTNFIATWVLAVYDHIRYLQAYDRDINSSIKNKGVGNTDTETEAVNGSSARLQNRAVVQTAQNNGVSVSDSQDINNGICPAVIDNETTSTQF